MHRIHYSKNPLVTIRSELGQGIDHKPIGLWYSVESGQEDGWKDFCVGNEFALNTLKYETLLTVDLSRFVVIRSVQQFDRFQKEFLDPDSRWGNINWAQVAEYFAGIEIAPYIWERRFSRDNYGAGWYYGWDVASGCVWDSSAVKIERAQNAVLQHILQDAKRTD